MPFTRSASGSYGFIHQFFPKYLFCLSIGPSLFPRSSVKQYPPCRPNIRQISVIRWISVIRQTSVICLISNIFKIFVRRMSVGWRISSNTGCSLNIAFFSRISNILRILPRQHWAAIGCTENCQPIRVTVHSDIRSDELLSCMQGMGCSELGKCPASATGGRPRARGGGGRIPFYMYVYQFYCSRFHSNHIIRENNCI